jgi:signal transduction histidine kinase
MEPRHEDVLAKCLAVGTLREGTRMTTANEFNEQTASVTRELFVLMLDTEGRVAGVSVPAGGHASQQEEGLAWIGKHIHEVFVPSGWQGAGPAVAAQSASFTGAYTAASVLNAGLTAFSVNVVALPERGANTMAYAAYARPLLSAKPAVSRDPALATIAVDRGQAIHRVVGGLAHDINNALFVITGLAEELLDEEAGAETSAAEHLKTIIGKVRQVGDKAHQILRLMENRRPQATPIVLQDVVAAVASRLRAAAPAGVHVQLHLDAAGAMARAYPTDVEHMLELGFSNALDALPKEGGVIQIGLTHSTLAGGGMLSLWLQDNGCGMSTEVQSRCMEPYYSTKEKAGLGLAIVKALARGMRAPLTIESTPGAGTRLQLELPVESPPPAAAKDSPAAG